MVRRTTLYWHLQIIKKDNMRRITTLLLCIFTVISCTDKHGKITDFHINENLKRSTLVTLPLSEQRDIIKNLNSEKQLKLWRAKLAYIVSQKDLNADEISIINNLKENLSTKFFEQNDSLFLTELTKSILKLQTEHNWSEERIFKNFMTIMTDDEFEHNVHIHHKK